MLDVFSYPEDESVIDPLLPHHLAHFGIDFSSLQKVSTLNLVSLACTYSFFFFP